MPGDGAVGGPVAGRRQKRWTAWLHNRTVRTSCIGVLLALCGLAILAIVRAETGTEGFVIGLVLATVPVPLLISALRWLDKVEPTPWRTLVFAFAWGACAATLVAIVANTFATEWLTTSVITNTDTDEDIVGAVLVAPVVEEIAKVAAILLLYLYRPRNFTGLLSGIVLAGFVATGFAFTENILYLGTAYDEDQELGAAGDGVSSTAATFVVRIIMSPFAHPLFTTLAGIGFGLAATLPARRQTLRIVLPSFGLLGSISLHALWNGTASLHGLAFLAVYLLLMAPLCASLIWLTVWYRGRMLRTVRDVLGRYAAQGWVTPAEAWGMGSMAVRSRARDLARREVDAKAARQVGEYQRVATSLALLRARAQSTADPCFGAREQELLTRLLPLRDLGSPYNSRAAAPAMPRAPYPYPPHTYPPHTYPPYTYPPHAQQQPRSHHAWYHQPAPGGRPTPHDPFAPPTGAQPPPGRHRY
ncbi:PrsW family intramembrane metalloprotease [Streptomyces alkaliterrae]|uniref:PrsW family intramembrane metalloprotease n=1 Tax=Streptomyces alkaliterrae TaxID=2213162 RepID=A0A5P0YUE9_9ACTN|nr:PrsW family intramembrane metalloprotease [Streptomyces alkaliterrae]MBB1259408.1 PrsW family intramembrane metalloprotease [Streptomyces alkaliterrae]MQS03936.1 PrsW family intramembrane metalloprotease [Streptomyces alkaliterrae]